MPRPCATPSTEGRVGRLVELLFDGYGDGGETIADLARDAGLEHETVRRLSRNPGGRFRTSPGFFIVASLAQARGISLDWLASKTLGYESDSGST